MLTRAQMMAEALNLAGLSADFYGLARVWINTIIETQARDFDWDFYAKTASDTTLVPGTLSYSVPADFCKPNGNMYLIQNSQRGPEIRVVDAQTFNLYKTGTGSGAPRMAMIVTSMGASGPTQAVHFDQVSSQTNTAFRMPYFRMPTALSTSDSDDTKVPDFLNQNFLIEEIIKYAFKYRDDERYGQQAGESQVVLRAAKMNQSNTAQPVVQLATDKFVPTGFRWWRRGSWMGP